MSLESTTDGVHVRTVRTDAPEIPRRIEAYRSLLPPDEAERAQRFVHEADATRFVIGRALARTMLSEFGNVPPQAWPFVIDEHGRPELAARPPGAPDLRFNLTHTEGLVACAVTIGREVGIDAEWIRRRITHDVPERFFSPREVADLRALPAGDQDVVFFDYWTLKEAYIKARGLGLALPLRQFTFIRTLAGGPTIVFAPDLHDDPASWQFAQFWPTPDHRMAVAVRRRGGDLPIVVAAVIPEVDA